MNMALTDLASHTQWLEQHSVLDALEIRPPEPEVMELRAAVLRAIGQQLAQETGEPRPLGLPNIPEALPAS
jgi:hypothetical protein